MAMMLITHDLGVVAENADAVAVMYASKVVECAAVNDLFESPKHPYTEGLFRAMPTVGEAGGKAGDDCGCGAEPVAFSEWVQVSSALCADEWGCGVRERGAGTAGDCEGALGVVPSH